MWMRYQELLKRRPFTVNVMQSGLLTGVATLTQHVISGEIVASRILRATLVAMCVITPSVTAWFAQLHRWKLRWYTRTLVDQFAFSPCLNILIFWAYDSLQGGLELSVPSFSELWRSSGTLHLCFSVHRDAFSSVFASSPIWVTLATSYKLWLPAAMLREKLVPRHFAQPFNTAVAFIWNMIFAAIMATRSASSM